MEAIIEIRNLKNSKPRYLWDFRADRTSPIGNPFIMNSESERDTVCIKYETFFYEQLESNVKFKEYLQLMIKTLKLYGKLNLYCWCYPKRCHAETIRDWLIKTIRGESI